MDMFPAVRSVAADARALVGGRDGMAGGELIGLAMRHHDIDLVRSRPGGRLPASVGGLFERHSRTIIVAEGMTHPDEAAVVAHELGHFHLHRDGVLASMRSGEAPIGGYSPREAAEAQADAFAAEFLCPSAWLRKQVAAEGRTPSAIAASLGLPEGLVTDQAILAVLLPAPLPPPVDPVALRPDGAQRRAVEWEGSALLVQGGPGTGKTTAAAMRIRLLAERRGGGASVLALLPSDAAARAMRSMVGPEIAGEAWIGTFQAFGRELASKWPARLGRTEKVRFLDRTAAMAVLARHGPRSAGPSGLSGQAAAIRAIARLKDRLAGPAEAGPWAADYLAYGDALARADALDAADLVPAAIRLIEEPGEARDACARRFRHVVADAAEDATPACRILLARLHALGLEVWMAGDDGQAINVFRGADASPLGELAAGLGADRVTLDRGGRQDAPRAPKPGRSGPAISGTRDARPAAGRRGKTAASEIGAAVEDFRRRGIRYGEQAVIARTHVQLRGVASGLTRLGMPVLYLGDLARSDAAMELRAITGCDTDGSSLERLLAGPGCGAPMADATALLAWAAARGLEPREGLMRFEEVPGISRKGVAAIRRLRADACLGAPGRRPSAALSDWLFERSGYLRPLLMSADQPASRRDLLAIYFTIRICQEHEAMGDDSPERLAYRLERAGAVDQETAYRSAASWAAEVDAVHIMTIHASKGVGFRAVHVLEAARPAPGADGPAPRQAVEASISRVALSRAREFLHIVRRG